MYRSTTRGQEPHGLPKSLGERAELHPYQCGCGRVAAVLRGRRIDAGSGHRRKVSPRCGFGGAVSGCLRAEEAQLGGTGTSAPFLHPSQRPSSSLGKACCYLRSRNHAGSKGSWLHLAQSQGSGDNVVAGTARTRIPFLRGWRDSVRLVQTPLALQPFGEMGGDVPIPKSWIKGSFQEHPWAAIPWRDTSLAPQKGEKFMHYNRGNTVKRFKPSCAQDEILPLAANPPQSGPCPLPQVSETSVACTSPPTNPALPEVVNCLPHSRHFRGPSAM